MNYIKEINAFYEHIERNPLSASAITLWYTLMHINNKARWAATFTVAAPVLRLKSGLTDSSFKRARTELKEKGYIDYQSRNKNQAPVYKMVTLVLEVIQETDWDENQDMNQQVDHLTNQDATNDLNTDYRTNHLPNQDENQHTDRVTIHHMDHYADHQADPLIKQKKDQKKSNKIKINDTAVTTDAFVFYQENFGVITPFVADTLMTWVNDVGEGLVLDAMKRALDQGKGTWGYVKGILQAWANKGITSVEAAIAEQAEFRRGKQKQAYSYAAETEEVVPDWFKEQKRKEKWKQEQKYAEQESQDQNVEHTEVAEMLAAYRNGRAVS